MPAAAALAAGTGGSCERGELLLRRDGGEGRGGKGGSEGAREGEDEFGGGGGGGN